MVKNRIKQLHDTWYAKKLKPALQKFPLRKEAFFSTSDIAIPDVAVPGLDMLSDKYFEENIGFPGQYPYTRGVRESMYRGRFWTMRQYAGFGTAREANQRYRYLLDQGSSGLSVAFDLPTQMGRDSDDPLSEGEVGRVGVAIDSIEDMEVLFADIPLDRVSVSMTINATAHILLALYIVLAKRRGISLKDLRGTVQNDILKEYIARGTYIYPPEPSLKIATDIFEYCSEHLPNFNTISISGYHIREAGSNAVQELAFTLANGITYVEAALKRGLEVDLFAPRLAFFFNCHNNFLEEVAKFRAARRMWARIMRNRFKARDPRSWKLRFHTQTAGSSLTAQDPEVNIVRTTVQALAAVCGGTQSLHTNAYDEALGLPTEESALIALRTQQVMAHESGIAESVDPLGGSYLIEQLTDELERKAEEYLCRIDDIGGMVSAIADGFPQREIEDAAYRYQLEIERCERIVVGVNAYSPSKDDMSQEKTGLKINPALEIQQVESLRIRRSKRNSAQLDNVKKKLIKSSGTGVNIMASVVDAVEIGMTLGEISSILSESYGYYDR